MEVNTIVLALTCLCGGAALVMLVVTYNTLKTKVNVTDYTIDMMETDRNLNDRLKDGDAHLNYELESLRNEIKDQRREIQEELSCLHDRADEINKRIDSRVDRLHHELTIKEESTK